MSTIEAINAVSLTSIEKVDNNNTFTSKVNQGSFLQHLEHLNQQLKVADSNLQDVAMGKPVKTHEILIQIEQTKLSFELAIETRNKLLEAYQTVMRMQI